MCDCFWKENMSSYFWTYFYVEESVRLILRIMSTSEMFWSEKQFKIKMMFMYFWLNYCDENHVERIPIAVKNINHLIESDRLICFCLLTALELMSMNTRKLCLYKETDPKIVDLIWIKKILKPQKYLLSIKHWLFFMTNRIAASSK